jgi:uncharacterized membrane protein YesL
MNADKKIIEARMLFANSRQLNEQTKQIARFNLLSNIYIITTMLFFTVGIMAGFQLYIFNRYVSLAICFVLLILKIYLAINITRSLKGGLWQEN